ncbi:MAG: hypothetical protein JNJ55_13765 [Betaproteobacteria bacterium]|nr:hypothetical protein [Betaproteobacteria bacterium]
MNVLLSLAEIVGWITFLYLGGTAVYELMGNRRVRASALLAGAVGWVVAMFIALKLGRAGGFAAVWLLAFICASGWLVWRVKRTLGKPDMDWR